MNQKTISILAILACLSNAWAAQASGQSEAKSDTICANLLHHYPTPAPLIVAVGERVVMTCQAEASGYYKPLRLTFADMADVSWWEHNAPDRVVIPGEGPND